MQGNRTDEAHRVTVTTHGSDRTLPLPSGWYEGHGLEPGDEVAVREDDAGRLVVDPAPDQGSGGRIDALDVSGFDREDVIRHVTALYVAGAETIRLRFPNDEPGHRVFEAARESVERLPGFRVTELTQGNVTIRAVAEQEGGASRGLVEAMHADVDAMLTDVVAACEADDPGEGLEAVAAAETTVDERLLRLTRRHHENLLGDPLSPPGQGVLESHHALLVGQFLERVGDYAVRIGDALSGATSQERVGLVADRLADAVETARVFVDEAYRAYAERDPALANDVAAVADPFCQRTRAQALDLLEGPRGPAQLPARRVFEGYFTILEAAERIALYAKSIAEVAIDRAAAGRLRGRSRLPGEARPNDPAPDGAQVTDSHQESPG